MIQLQESTAAVDPWNTGVRDSFFHMRHDQKPIGYGHPPYHEKQTKNIGNVYYAYV